MFDSSRIQEITETLKAFKFLRGSLKGRLVEKNPVELNTFLDSEACGVIEGEIEDIGRFEAAFTMDQLKRSPWWLYKYLHMSGGEFTSELCAIIAKDATAALEYIFTEMGGKRWKEAEPAIARIPRIAAYYARYVLGDKIPLPLGGGDT